MVDSSFRPWSSVLSVSLSRSFFGIGLEETSREWQHRQFFNTKTQRVHRLTNNSKKNSMYIYKTRNNRIINSNSHSKSFEVPLHLSSFPWNHPLTWNVSDPRVKHYDSSIAVRLVESRSCIFPWSWVDPSLILLPFCVRSENIESIVLYDCSACHRISISSSVSYLLIWLPLLHPILNSRKIAMF